MLPVNDNGYSPNLQIAVWKMVRAGVPAPVILSTLGLTVHDLERLRTMKTMARPPATYDRPDYPDRAAPGRPLRSD